MYVCAPTTGTHIHMHSHICTHSLTYVHEHTPYTLTSYTCAHTQTQTQDSLSGLRSSWKSRYREGQSEFPSLAAPGVPNAMSRLVSVEMNFNSMFLAKHWFPPM